MEERKSGERIPINNNNNDTNDNNRSYGYPGVEVALANAALQRYLVKPVM